MYPTKEELLKEIQKYDGLYSLKKYGISRKIYNMPKGKTIFFFKKSEDFNFWVKEYYMKTANEISVINNILNEDKTINYKVSYDTNRIEDIFNMNILNNYNNYIAIKSYSLQEILAIVSESQIFKNLIFHNIDVTEQQKIFKEITLRLKRDDKKTVKKLYNLYLRENETYNAFNEIVCWNYRMNNFKDSMEAVVKAYNKRDRILRELMGLPPNVKLKNTSELLLYKIVRDIFSDTIYQYRTEWLGRQSIDIYIPSKKIAIEYQGEQHYNPINVFGRKEALEKRKRLDMRKRELCKENNIQLIEWKYNELISTENLIKKLKSEHLLM